jgi:hypothetical protein
VACGRSARDTTPTWGTLFSNGARELLEVRVEVEEVTPD